MSDTSEPDRAASSPGRAPLLATKLFVPRLRPGLIARPRLTRRLREALQSPLILVSAGAGFGKTTLLAEWNQSTAGSDMPLGWLSLDKEDSDPARFWTYFIAALQTVLPGFGEDALVLLRSAQPPPASVLLPLLINELAALTNDVTLVLDDYHLIGSPPVHEAIALLVDRMPPRFHLVILTREDPAWLLARWRATGLLSELRAGDLRFTPDEAAGYLREAAGVVLSTADVSVLEARTEGWIVGLQMAALSLRGRVDVAEFVRNFAGTNRYVLEFLVEEVLNRQPAEVQEFLLQTSILEQLTARLCDAVVGCLGAGEMLEKLERANLFLVLLDEDRRWYRYHHLFAELLRDKLRQTQPDLDLALYRRAGEWCEKEGLIGEAMSYQLAAGDQERAAQLAEQSCLEMMKRSDPGFVKTLGKLPDDVVRRRPWLAAYRAVLDIVWGRWDNAKMLLYEAERSTQADRVPPDSSELLPFVRIMSAYIAELEGVDANVAAVVEASRAAIPKSKQALWNTFDHWLGVTLFLRGDFQGAEEVWMRSVQEDLRTGATNALAGNLVAIVRMWVIQGRLREASDLCHQWLRWMDERGRWRFFRAGDILIVLGEIHRERNDLEEALTLVDEGIKESQLWPTANNFASSYAAKARAFAAIGQIEPALATLDELAQLLRGLAISPDLRGELAACRVSICLAAGDTASAAKWTDDRLMRGDNPPSFRREHDGISLARLLLALGEPGKALALLARLEGGASWRARWSCYRDPHSSGKGIPRTKGDRSRPFGPGTGAHPRRA